jgi:hypothetical protein
MIERFRNLQHRSIALDQLSDAIAAHSRRAFSTDKRYAHIPPSERSRLSKLCLETQRWINNSTTGDPSIITTEVILDRRRELDELARSVYNCPRK